MHYAWQHLRVHVWTHGTGQSDLADEILRSSRRADPACGRPQELADIGLERIDQFIMVKIGDLTADALSDFNEDEIEYLERVYSDNRFKASLPVVGPNIDIN